MAKKILILLAVVLVCFASYSAFALDLTDDEDFIELTTDSSFMLDSPLFTQKEELVDYVQEMGNEKAFGKDPVISYGDYDLYVADFDYSEFEGYEDDEDLADDFKKKIERSRAFNIRIVNRNTGYVWATDGQGNTRQTTAFVTYISGKDFTGEINSNSVNTRVSYETKGKDTVVFHVDLINDGISFDYSVTLNENGFNLNMDSDSIKETSGGSSLLKVSFFPYFGSVYVEKDATTNEKRSTIPGYIVLPTGNGGLIRYTANTTISDNYSAPFYGSDLNYYNNNTEIQNTLSMPVFGIVHGVNQEACLVEIKNGSTIATFNYEAPGINASDYHRSYLTFNYRRSYSMKTSTAEFNMVSDKIECDVDVKYSFLSGEKANYIGIAREYQKSLVEAGVLGKTKLSDSTQMHLEAFGREYEEGLIGRKYINMTTINDITDMNHELELDGVENVFYTLKGYYKGGYSGAVPTNVTFENKLGNLNHLSNEGIEYYLYYNPVETRGFRLQLPGYNLVNVYRKEYYFEEEKDAKYTFFTDVKTINEGLERVNKKYDDKVAYDGVTQYLYGDYNNEYTRQQTLDSYVKAFGNEKYPMYVPNAYLLKNTEKYLNMHLYHEMLKFVTDSVPFTQIVLRGYVDLYSSYLNFSSNQELDALKCIEYGVYPAYLVTQEPSHKLSKTLSNNLYATEYSRVKDQMVKQYADIKAALDPVVGAQIIGRNVLEVGVVEVIYSNGVTIVVNYTNDVYPYSSDVVINPMKAEVIING